MILQLTKYQQEDHSWLYTTFKLPIPRFPSQQYFHGKAKHRINTVDLECRFFQRSKLYGQAIEYQSNYCTYIIEPAALDKIEIYKFST